MLTKYVNDQELARVEIYVSACEYNVKYVILSRLCMHWYQWSKFLLQYFATRVPGNAFSCHSGGWKIDFLAGMSVTPMWGDVVGQWASSPYKSHPALG